MEWYSIFKFIHVAAVIVWLGGGLALVLLGARANRANDGAEFGNVLKNLVYLSGSVFVPSAMVALVFGLILFFVYGIYGSLWVYIGLLGFAATFGLGILVLKPRSEKAVEMLNREGLTPAVLDQGRDILRLAQFDMVVLFVVVADMVLKPEFQNWLTLIIMILVIVAGAYYFVRDLFMGIANRVAQKA